VPPPIPELAPDELLERADVVVLDVREDTELAEGCIADSSHIPLGQLPARVSELDRSRAIVTVCRSGRRSARAAQWLVGQGFDVANLAGGMARWIADGRPVAPPSPFPGHVPLPRTVKEHHVQIDVIETTGLGDRSYLVSAGEIGVVVDPQRDIDRVLDLAARRGVRIALVLETHLHNDYLTGGLELARAVGAEYVVPAGDSVAYDRVPAADDDVLQVGAMRLRVLHTPGHTHHHVSYVLADADGAVQAVFTGGSMLYGATGRTDLVGPEHTDELTRAQYRSVRRLADELPPGTPVFPTHGFGSFCSATPTSGNSSTVGEQIRVNPALTQDEQSFVDELIAGLTAVPAWYARMGPGNAAGPAPVDLSMPRPVDPDELADRLAAGEWVIDLRTRTAFAAGHLPGALSFELAIANFVTYMGWLVPWGAPITLIGETEDQVADARRELVRIGIDRLAGAAIGETEELAAGAALLSHPVSDFVGLAAAMAADPQLVVVDARRADERAGGGVHGSLHIPIHELADRLDEVPDGAVWVYCGSGYRASIAASLLARRGRRPVLVDGAYGDPDTGAAAVGLHDGSLTH
jgi:rhodanese-related sulfurtransferase/glyoxylase-like metal-dependent hydrolase (beta-lactamase superfamily II)